MFSCRHIAVGVGAMVLALSMTCVVVAAKPPSPGVSPTGDWVGWAYLDEGGDFPLRFRIETGANGLVARFDELVSQRYDLPVDHLAWAPPAFSLRRTRPGGAVISMTGTIQGDGIEGRFDWAGHKGNFEMAKSPILLTRTPPRAFVDCEGIYRLSNGDTLVIGSRFWGELLYTDLGTGRFGTLFPTDTDEFFLGGAIYVPSPIEARLRFIRKGDNVRKVEQRDGDGTVVSGERTPITEEQVSFESDGVKLSGTVLRPAGSHALPGAVVLGGSNWARRSSNRRDAEIFASFGMTTLIYDKRGFGESGGKRTVPFLETARDAAAAARFLEKRPDVIDGEVGLVGRSRTGWVAPLAASIEPRIAYLVLFVPPAVSPAVQETTRRTDELEDAGAKPETIAAVKKMLAAAWRWAATGDGWDQYVQLREKAKDAGAPDDVFEPSDPNDPSWQWTRLNMGYDPVPTLEEVRTPLLALFGGEDRNVVPEDNVPRMRKALEKAGNRDFKLIVVPGVNHGLRVVHHGLEIPMHRQTGFGPSGWLDVEGWLGRHVDLGGSGVELRGNDGGTF